MQEVTSRVKTPTTPTETCNKIENVTFVPKLTDPTTDVALHECLHGLDPALMKKQSGFVNRLMDYYFRLQIGGGNKLPNQPALFIGAHSGGPLTMDAWTIAYAWWRHFEGRRTLHATAHDVLMKTPSLGRYFRRMGVISLTRENIQAAFAQGDDVILWLGGEKDAFRRQHIPLPSKIRTEFLEPIYFDANPALADDKAYVRKIYDEVLARIQSGMDRLAKKRKFPIFG